MTATVHHKLPTQADLKKVCKAAFDSGADRVRLEVAGFVIEATKDSAASVVTSPLEHWRRANGQG
jgi:hypothetical protein